MATRVSNEVEEGVTTSLPISQIQVNAEENLRRVDKEFVSKRLIPSIQKNGLFQNVVVRTLPEPVNGFTHRLDAGYQRMAAITELGWTDVPVTVIAENTSSMSVNMSENAIRKDTNYIELAEGIKRRVDAGDKPAEIAQDLGKTLAYVHQVLPLIDPAKMRPSVQKAVADGKFTFRVARALPGMSEEEQDQLIANVEAAGEGGSTDIVESAVRTKKKKSGKGRKGRTKDTEKAQGAAAISTKKALLLIGEVEGELMEAAKVEGADKDSIKDAVTVLRVFEKFLSGKIGPQAMGKQLTKKMAQE